ncbi:MAG: (2Fe-2S)-binding protein [Desulfobulbaceae bacterium]|jgi:bacterioferritin-associated ferredoxin|nr:(2Fe-2S)-binding protein [Desulfobulbaceae bacterium]
MDTFTENVLEAPDDELVCWCAGVSAKGIRDAVKNGARTLADIRAATGACSKGDCKNNNPRGRCCSVEIVQFLPREKFAKAAEFLLPRR